jgi:hypothetical protein
MYNKYYKNKPIPEPFASWTVGWMALNTNVYFKRQQEGTLKYAEDIPT